MVKKDIVTNLQKTLGMSFIDAKAAVEETLKQLGDALAKGERVELRGFGVFYPRLTKERVGRNPKTGEEYPVPQRVRMVFKLSEKLDTTEPVPAEPIPDEVVAA
jgi:nucleoid DNA-binding protein